MNPTEILITLLIGIVCGTLAQLTSGYSKGGWIVNIAIGFLGALAGVVVSRLLDAPVIYDLRIEGVAFPLVYCLIGTVLFLAAISLVIKPGRH